MKKQAIVAETRRPPLPSSAPHTPGPLEGARFLLGVARRAQLPASSAREIAFAGRSNAGKSSAINALARQNRLAFASRTPGRTQQINFFELRCGALLADLPGYGYAAVPRDLKNAWQALLTSYVTTRDPLIGLVIVVDARHGIREQDLEVMRGFLSSGRPLLVLATKIDKLNQAERRTAVQVIRRSLEAFAERADAIRVIPFSATTGQGVESANEVLSDWLGIENCGNREVERSAPGERSNARATGNRKRPRDQGE